jgi:hypothetical protein
MKTDVTIHMASEADLDALVRLAVAFRDHVGQMTPSFPGPRLPYFHGIVDETVRRSLAF